MFSLASAVLGCAVWREGHDIGINISPKNYNTKQLSIVQMLGEKGKVRTFVVVKFFYIVDQLLIRSLWLEKLSQ